MKSIQEDILAVKQVLQESCDQCCQGAFCISYFKRLRGTISLENQEQIHEIINNVIKENIKGIEKKLSNNPWLIYDLDSKFPTESKTMELSKVLTATIVENISKNRNITLENIEQVIPKWLTKNDQDLVLGSVIQFLFYLNNYTDDEV